MKGHNLLNLNCWDINNSGPSVLYNCYTKYHFLELASSQIKCIKFRFLPSFLLKPLNRWVSYYSQHGSSLLGDTFFPAQVLCSQILAPNLSFILLLALLNFTLHSFLTAYIQNIPKEPSPSLTFSFRTNSDAISFRKPAFHSGLDGIFCADTVKWRCLHSL